MLIANQIKLHPASILPFEKKKVKKTQPEKYMSLELVPMLDAASNVVKASLLPPPTDIQPRNTYAQSCEKRKR